MMTHSQLCSLLDRTGSMLDFGRAIHLCHHLLDADVYPGDIVEFGCYLGHTAKLFTALSSKRVWVYDSFDGLPDQTEADKGCDMGRGCLRVTPEDLIANFKADGLPEPRIIKKWFKDVTPDDLPEQIAFAHIDGDFYESIRDALNIIWPRVVGSVIVDDFGDPRFPGVECAVLEFTRYRPEMFYVIPGGPGGAPCRQALLVKEIL